MNLTFVKLPIASHHDRSEWFQVAAIVSVEECDIRWSWLHVNGRSVTIALPAEEVLDLLHEASNAVDYSK